jgi:ankyrin repeat protein
MVQHLPHDMEIRTPTMKTVSPSTVRPQNTTAQIYRRHTFLFDGGENMILNSSYLTTTPRGHPLHSKSSEPLDMILTDASHSSHRLLLPSFNDIGSSGFEDFSYEIADWFNDFYSNVQFGTLPSPQYSFQTINVAAFDTPMATLITMTHSLQQSLQHLKEHKSPLFAKMVREWQESTDRSNYQLRELDEGQTGQLLQELPLDIGIVYRVMFLLMNDFQVLDLLQDDGQEKDQFFKSGVQYLHALPPPLLNGFLDTIPSPFSHALEHSLFCAAVELGAYETINTILQRCHLNLCHAVCIVSGQQYAPLERAALLGHIEVVRCLLIWGASPNHCFVASPLRSWSKKQGEIDRHIVPIDEEDHHLHQAKKRDASSTWEIFTLLVQAGGTLGFNETSLCWEFFSANTLRFLTENIDGPQHKLLVESGLLTEVISIREYQIDKIIVIAKSILSRGYPNSVRKSGYFTHELSRALFRAVSRANSELVEVLLSAGAIPDSDCLLLAVRKKCLKVIERFLDLGLSANAIVRESFGTHSLFRGGYWKKTTPLAEAMRQCYYAGIQLFKSRGFMSSMDHNEDSLAAALEAACSIGHTELVEQFLSQIQPEQIRDLSYAITEALQNDHHKLALKLMDAGFRPDSRAIACAIDQQNAGLLRRLLDVRADTKEEEAPILFKAVVWGDFDIVKDLILAGFDLHQCGELSNRIEGQRKVSISPLTASIFTENTWITDLLLRSGAPRFHGEDDVTPLSGAIFKKDPQLVRDLFQWGADPYDNQAVYLAATLQNVPLAKYLVEAFQWRYPNGRVGYGTVALHEAIRRQDIPMLNELAKIVDGNHITDDLSPLGAAIKSGSDICLEMIRILVENNTNPNAMAYRSDGGYLPAIYLAILTRQLAVVKELVKYGAKMDNLVVWGLLQYAAELGVEDIVKYLLQHVDPNERPAILCGGTALQLAALHGHGRIAALLLERGANVNAMGPKSIDRTAFERAAEHGRINMMLLLAQNGVDLTSYNGSQSRRAFRFAKEKGQIGAMKLTEQLYRTALQEEKTQCVPASNTEIEGSVVEHIPDCWPPPESAESMTNDYFGGLFL